METFLIGLIKYDLYIPSYLSYEKTYKTYVMGIMFTNNIIEIYHNKNAFCFVEWTSFVHGV